MREIKFRAWDKEKKQMWYDNTEDFYNTALKTEYQQNLMLCMNGELRACHWYGNNVSLIPSGFILMQFTGLKDKNGKEETDVYADDKIIITDGDFEVIGVVKMNDKTGQWVWIATEVEASALTVYKGREIPLWEVLDKQYRWKGCLVGNIHENPELLEAKE